MAELQYKTHFNDSWRDKDDFKVLKNKFLIIIINYFVNYENLQIVYLPQKKSCY